MKNKLYKIVAIILLIYSAGMGLLIPLSPGVKSVFPAKIQEAGKFEIEIIGYNTHFQQNQKTNQIWLRNDSNYISATKIRVENEFQVFATFNIPNAFFECKNHLADLIINNDYDGSFAFRKTIILNPDDRKGTAILNEIPNLKRIIKNKDAQFISFPNREILYESIRNLYFHVPMWFAMIIILLVSMIYSILYLRTNKIKYDWMAKASANVGLLMGCLGMLTGMLWAQFAWGSWWSGDVKQNMAAVALMIYFAYFILRNSLQDDQQRAKISAVYNIFAFVAAIPLMFIIPKMVDSLHPGNGGNPAFNKYDLNGLMRLVFYPAILGWTFLGFWIAEIIYRLEKIKNRLEI